VRQNLEGKMESELNIGSEVNGKKKNKSCGPMVKKHGEGDFKVVITIPEPIRKYTARIKEFLSHIALVKDRYSECWLAVVHFISSSILFSLHYVLVLIVRLNGEPAHYNAFIEKYHKFMDLKHKHPGRRLIPSIELEWVWYTHLLRPKFYLAWCDKKYAMQCD
jgi:hypothetical protein